MLRATTARRRPTHRGQKEDRKNPCHTQTALGHVRTHTLPGDARLEHRAQRAVFTHTHPPSVRAHTQHTRTGSACTRCSTHARGMHTPTRPARTHPACTHPCAHLQAHSVHPAMRALVERTSHGGTRKLLHRTCCRQQLSLCTTKMRLWKPELTLRKGKGRLRTLSVELWTLNGCALPKK